MSIYFINTFVHYLFSNMQIHMRKFYEEHIFKFHIVRK